MKKCFKCNIKKDLTQFYKHPQMSDGTVNKCKECNKKDVRDNLYSKKEYYAKYDRERIRNNFNYIFLHRYSGMMARIKGSIKRNYSVVGKEICRKDEFIKWCLSENNLKKFLKLHTKWKQKKYCKKLCPSIDRINNKEGYILSNLQWITQQQNSSKYNK